MDKINRALRNFQNANQEFRRTSGLYKNLSRRVENWRIAMMYSTHIAPGYMGERRRNENALRNSHTRMLTSYTRRDNAFKKLQKLTRTQNNTMTIRQMINKAAERMYAPPRTPGGIGGPEYEKLLRHSRRGFRKPSRVNKMTRPHSI
jgi:hypothetical protein